MNDIIKVNENTKVYVDGKITEEVKKTLDELYRKEVEPSTGTSLESQVFQQLNDAISYYEINSNEIQDEDIGMLYIVDEPQMEDLSVITKSISTMTRPQQINSAIVTNSNNLIKNEIQRICNNRDIPVFTSLETYSEFKRGKQCK